jgi:hypothetical protein
VADTHAWRYSAEVAEGGLAPLEESVAFAISLELEKGVGLIGFGRAEFVDLHGVVDDQLGGDERVDLLGVAAESFDSVAHGAEINDGRDTGKVLHQHACGHIGDLAAGLGLSVPLGKELDVIGRDVDAVFAAEQVLEQNFEAERQAR